MRSPRAMVAVLALVASGATLGAQESAPARFTSPLIFIGSAAEDRLRLAQLRGDVAAGDWLVRTPSRMSPRDSGGLVVALPRVCRLSASTVPGTAALYWNSEIPFARNDAGVWAGRGATGMVSGGARASCGRVRVYAVPEVWHARNDAYQVLPSGNPVRSDFTSPFHSIPQSSADLPLRLGTNPITTFQLGQTSVTVDAGWVAAGWSSESEWWGPGIRNALVMSNNAAGIPRWFAGTAHPVPTRVGAVTARLISGILTESRFFHRFEKDVRRPLSGIVVMLTPAFDSGLSIGAARTVYRRRTTTLFPAYALDALTYWSLRSPEDSADQVSSLFARWVFPKAGFEMYGEWAKSVLPSSFTEFLVAPQLGQGYTVGLQWLSGVSGRDTARPPARDAHWRVQLEITDLEQLRQARFESPPTFYTSPVVPHGYTQRGRVIGAAIGPGAQSQWFALDRVTPGGMAGAFLGRARWEEDEFFARPSGLSFYAHDVSVYGGVRGSRRLGAVDVSGEALYERRMNYLFQHANQGFGDDPTFDVNSVSLRFAIAPAIKRTR